MTSWKTQLPDKPTPNIVVVTNISPSASEKTVKDFFLFCGKIKEFELQKDESGKQTALVWFEREAAAKTACMLNNAMIVDTNCTVKPFFEGAAPSSPDASSSSGAEGNDQESKAKTHVMVDILAAGYQLQEQIVARAVEVDQKYSVSTRVGAYFKKLQEIAKNLDDKYKVSETVQQRATQLDEKYKVQDKVKQGQERVHQVLQTPAGQTASSFAQSLYTQSSALVQAVYLEAKKVAEEKKARQAPPQEDSQASSASAPQQ
ncbi:uncharacterized protein VTP21DRAFT_4078 [Calcarisporiella thermophila]|uniref:uncharacterized protein n=1 Tax=Calcarisporiella thermophila TaxID=911321 RepID=UPI0037434A4B